jgi:2,4-dienoyl-CoA reductase-like NADH-dependent reductase (Old Yellow Enzyme family)
MKSIASTMRESREFAVQLEDSHFIIQSLRSEVEGWKQQNRFLWVQLLHPFSPEHSYHEWSMVEWITTETMNNFDHPAPKVKRPERIWAELMEIQDRMSHVIEQIENQD